MSPDNTNPIFSKPEASGDRGIQEEVFVPRQGFSEEISDEQASRIKDSQKDVQIEHSIFEDCLQKMSLVLSSVGNSKPKGLMIIGASDSGKSTLLKAFRTRLEEQEEKFFAGKKKTSSEDSETPLEHYSVKPAFLFSIPSGATANSILERALMLNGIVLRNRMNLTQMENLLYDKLEILKTRVILVDEFHDISRIGHKHQQDILKVLKEMTNHLLIPIIAAGTSVSEAIIESDEQIYTRLRKIHLRPFESDHNFRDFLLHYKEARIRLRHGIDFEDEELVGYLHDRTKGLVGQVTQLLSLAVKQAILTGSERITLEDLKKIPLASVSAVFAGQKQNSYGI